MQKTCHHHASLVSLSNRQPYRLKSVTHYSGCNDHYHFKKMKLILAYPSDKLRCNARSVYDWQWGTPHGCCRAVSIPSIACIVSY